MKEKIITKASEMFLKLGFKASQWMILPVKCVFLKKRFTNIFTIKNFLSKKALHRYIKVHGIIDNIVNKKHAIHENFEIRKMFKDMFQSDDSPIYQLKKHYPEIYGKVMLGSLRCSYF
jgi:hypothetical protein